MLKNALVYFVLSIILVPFTLFSQTEAELAKNYFSNYRSKNAMNALILKSLPPLSISKKIFIKEEDAKKFTEYMVALENALKEQKEKEDESYALVEVNTFTKKEIESGKTNYNLGLLKVIDKIKPSLRFYTIKLMNNEMFETGYSYIYWVNIDKKWYFISLPQNAFKK